MILGKTNMHELAAGIIDRRLALRQTRNPYDLDRNPGGSSGGTGALWRRTSPPPAWAATRAGRSAIPASHNNLVGLRGTQGLSSRTGIVPLSSTQESADRSRAASRISPSCSTRRSAPIRPTRRRGGAGHIPASYRAALRVDTLKGARIGVMRACSASAGRPGGAPVVQKALDG